MNLSICEHNSQQSRVRSQMKALVWMTHQKVKWMTGDQGSLVHPMLSLVVFVVGSHGAHDELGI